DGRLARELPRLPAFAPARNGGREPPAAGQRRVGGGVQPVHALGDRQARRPWVWTTRTVVGTRDGGGGVPQPVPAGGRADRRVDTLTDATFQSSRSQASRRLSAAPSSRVSDQSSSTAHTVAGVSSRDHVRMRNSS